PPFPLGHPTPDAVLDAVIERMSQALGAHRTARAHGLGLVLCRALDEQLVWVSGAAGRSLTPDLLVIPDHPDAVLSPVRQSALPRADAVPKRYGTNTGSWRSPSDGNPFG